MSWRSGCQTHWLKIMGPRRDGSVRVPLFILKTPFVTPGLLTSTHVQPRSFNARFSWVCGGFSKEGSLNRILKLTIERWATWDPSNLIKDPLVPNKECSLKVLDLGFSPSLKEIRVQESEGHRPLLLWLGWTSPSDFYPVCLNTGAATRGRLLILCQLAHVLPVAEGHQCGAIPSFLQSPPVPQPSSASAARHVKRPSGLRLSV